MSKRQVPVEWRLLLLVGIVAIAGIAATYHRDVLGETGSAVTPSTAAAPRPTPEQCVSDPDSVACLKARIRILEAAAQNQLEFVREIHDVNRTQQTSIRELWEANQQRPTKAELAALKGDVSALKTLVGKPEDQPQQDSNKAMPKGDFDNLWMAINRINNRLKRAGH